MCLSDEDDYKNINFPTFIPAKKNIYEWNKLDFEFDTPFIFHDSRLDLEKEKIFDLWENKFDIKKNVHITDNLQLHYNYKGKCIPFLLKIENISGIIQKGRHLPRITYFEVISTGQTELLFSISTSFVEKLYDLTQVCHKPLDYGMIRLEGIQRLPINKITYFQNLIVCFEKMEKVTYRNKEKYCLVARVIDGEVFLPKKNQCYNSDSE